MFILSPFTRNRDAWTVPQEGHQIKGIPTDSADLLMGSTACRLLSAAVLFNVEQIRQLDLVLLASCQLDRKIEPLKARTLDHCFHLGI